MAEADQNPTSGNDAVSALINTNEIVKKNLNDLLSGVSQEAEED
ncbi:hypothetical protein [Nocardia terrae]|nr:hypothetical protein [Nocardia terrae]